MGSLSKQALNEQCSIIKKEKARENQIITKLQANKNWRKKYAPLNSELSELVEKTVTESNQIECRRQCMTKFWVNQFAFWYYQSHKV